MNSPLKSAGLAVTALLAALCLSHPAGAIEIVAPKDGAVVPIGAELVIQVQPSPGDDIDRAYLAHSDEHMKHNPQTGYFEQRIKLRGNTLGPIEIEVWSRNSQGVIDRKSTRLNSSHSSISYAVFCLKKKKKNYTNKDYTKTN